MEFIKVESLHVSELSAIDLTFSQELRARANELAIELVRSNITTMALRSVKVLTVKDKKFACEHYPLILALKRIQPTLQIDCLLIAAKSTAEAYQAISDQMKISSLLTLNAVEIPAFEICQTHDAKLMPMNAWAEILQVHRSTLYKHKQKFEYAAQDTHTDESVDLDDLLHSIPNPQHLELGDSE